MSLCVVLTSINEPGAILKEWIARRHTLVVVGDRKTPGSYKGLPLTYLDVDEQTRRYPKFAEALPYNHYARKNIGYLHAIDEGVQEIAETDDDNFPLPGWPRIPDPPKRRLITAPRYPNIYSLYSDAHVWPRGFPLDLVNANETIKTTDGQHTNVAIWQGLVNGDPDVDAIFRLTSPAYQSKGFAFAENGAYVLDKQTLSAFNTQNTVWTDPSAFPYLYLPSTVSFRATDIIKSYVAQYCIWAIGGHVAFNGPTAVQERNPHNLITDFKAEWALYTQFHDFMEALDNVIYAGNADDLYRAYEALAKANLVEKRELDLVEMWLRLSVKPSQD